ncbi:MAG: MFS transporter [Anaerolineae bacterium]
MSNSSSQVSRQDKIPNENWILVATILPSSMGFIAGTALNIALPALQQELGALASDVIWIVNAYTLLLSALILLGGSLGDRLGRKRVFMVGIAIFTVTSFLCGFANSVGLLIALRLLQGIGGALMVPGSLAILSVAFPPNQRGRAVGTWSTFSAIVTVLGAPLGGLLAGLGQWRLVFFINVPLGILALFVLNRYVSESKDETTPPQLDYLGALLIVLALAGLTYGFTELPNLGFSALAIQFALVGGVVAFLLFMVWEARTQHPLVPLKLFRSKTFTGTNLLTLLIYATIGVFPVLLPLNIIQVQGYPEAIAGLVTLPFGIVLALMGRFSGQLLDRIGSRIPLVLGSAITGIGYVLLAANGLTTGPDSYWGTFFPAIMALGLGMGFIVAPLTTTVMNAAPSEAVGTASGINNAVARIAGVLALAVFGAVTLTLFSNSLQERVTELGVSAEIHAAVMGQAAQLAEATPPPNVPPDTAAAIAASIKGAFIDAFQFVMLMMAVLCWFGGVMGLLLVESREVLLSKHQAVPIRADSSVEEGQFNQVE